MSLMGPVFDGFTADPAALEAVCEEIAPRTPLSEAFHRTTFSDKRRTQPCFLKSLDYRMGKYAEAYQKWAAA